MPELPTIVLDATLADLYRRASPKNASKRIAQVLCGVNCGFELSSNFPRNAKYLYQDSPFNTTNKDAPRTPGSSARLRRDLAMKYLSLIPQRDAFICGDTAVVLFNLGETAEQKAHDKREAEATIAVLEESQRPELLFCAGPSKIPIADANIDLIAYKLVIDGLEDYKLMVPPDTHWLINSKEALATSGLPTPPADVIDLLGFGGEARLCCTPCQEDTAEFLIPIACEGVRGKWLEDQSRRIYDALKARTLPFVLKNQQTFGGAGTYIIRTEEERDKVIEDLQGGILRKLLSSVTEDNVHLRPASLVLSDLVAEPVGDYGLTFFVTDDGSEPMFLAASEQMIENGNAWVGSTINYCRQPELQRKFGKLVSKIAAWLSKHNYVGPAGADVLETATPTTSHPAVDDDLSCFHIVDLNVRTSGSLALPLLRKHFTSRGLYNASSFSISVGKRRDDFIEEFRDEFVEGKMCILSWYEDPDSDVSLADVAVGAEDEEKLMVGMQRVRDATDGVTF